MSQFNFANPELLILILAIPLYYLMHKLRFGNDGHFNKDIQSFADKRLLPHLVKGKNLKIQSQSKIRIWPLLWILAVLALAQPRWGYEEVQTYSQNNNLVILLDLSQSMGAADVKPSRIARARQEIEDILKMKDPDTKIALIAFSATAHLISPLTFDVETIAGFLPYIDTGLVSLQGKNLQDSLDVAEKLLQDSGSGSKSILVMSDGGFDDIKNNISSDISISMMGFGTESGAPIRDSKGNLLKEQGQIIIDKLQSSKMKKSVKNGGIYVKANFLDHDSKKIIDITRGIFGNNMTKDKNNKIIYWNEVFYIPIALMMAIILLSFVKSSILLSLILIFSFSDIAHAQIFSNSAQQAKEAYNNKDYDLAAEKFKNSYQKGVSLYRAGNYEQAQQLFLNSDNVYSQYNLGNSYFKQSQFDKAINSYENYLKTNPDDEDAKHNLELAKKMLQKQQNSSDSNQDNKDQQNKDSDSKDQNSQDGADSEDSKKEDSEGDQEESEKNESEKKDGKQNNSKEQKPNKKNQTQKNSDENQNQEPKNSNNQKLDPEQQRRDFNANRQLNKIKSNPANILKNQFYIEEQKFLLKEND